ncbi:restriction endonuclease subunit S [Pectinatus frisingensis]|uniref:restriction endonuclease subunit S n=1 Tax=Pectinatus frisingensis TaxID=865 RepID=UPI003D809D6B
MRAMKDSGVEWIGDIPAEWKIIRLKYVAHWNINTLPENTLEDTLIKYIDISSVSYDNGIIQIQELNFSDAPSRARRVLTTGDTIISTVRTYLKAIAYIIPKYNNYICSTGFAVYTPNPEILGKYLYYSLCAHYFISMIEAYSVGISYPAINSSTLSNLNIVFAPYEKQHRIADYLDDRCSKIDTLIAQEQTVIEKLKEYRQSMITQAVTKGLDPDVPMKNSGVEWIGKIPADWDIRKIKYLFKLRNERNYLPLETINLLSLYTDIGVFPHGEQEERGNKAVSADGYKKVYKNDIVVNIILAWMGAIGISNYNGVTSPAYDIYMPLSSMVCSKYFNYLFRTKGFAGECYKYGRGIMAMRWRTYSNEFLNILVPVPTFSMQIIITEHLDSRCSAIDATISKKQTLIDKLTEYKKSLIYEVVTGKKEV